jgi:type II secretory pathway pseudopilin PulG
MLPDSQYRIKGFTTFEILVVLVLIGIFSVVTIAWYADQGSAALRARADVLVSHLRYAQMRSMNTGTSWGIGCDAVTKSYWLYKQNPQNLQDLSNRRMLPGETENTVRLDSYGVSPANSFWVAFDTWGRPGSNLPFSGGRLSLNLQKGGRSDITLQIVEETGFVF